MSLEQLQSGDAGDHFGGQAGGEGDEGGYRRHGPAPGIPQTSHEGRGVVLFWMRQTPCHEGGLGSISGQQLRRAPQQRWHCVRDGRGGRQVCQGGQGAAAAWLAGGEEGGEGRRHTPRHHLGTAPPHQQQRHQGGLLCGGGRAPHERGCEEGCGRSATGWQGGGVRAGP